MRVRILHNGKVYSFPIRVGYRNAIRRHPDETIDRKFRRKLKKLSDQGIVIINIGRGYFIPNPNDPLDRLQYRKYDQAEYSKELKIRKRRFVRRLAWFKECEKHGA